MAINSNFVKNYQTAEYGKFKQFPIDDTSYPAVSVTRIGYYDASSAFPGNTGTPTYSAVDIYPKYAVLTHLTNASDISVSLSAGDLNIYVDEIEVKLDEVKAKQDTTNYLLSAQLGQQGFDFIESGTPYSGPYTTIQIVSAAKITAISGPGITPGNIANYELPINFSFNGYITNIELTYGAAIAYKL